MRSTLLFCSIFVAIFWSSCSTDFDLTSEWKDIPIVYGILDLGDDVHYIRIEKAFLDPNTSALDIAQNPDSLFYENLDVKIKKGNSEFSLIEVNAEEEGLVREEGIFASTPNILYKISNDVLDLKANDNLELIINRGDNLPLVTANTVIVGASNISVPLSTSPIAFKPGLSTLMTWSNGANSVVFDLRFIIKYDEFPTDNIADLTSHELEWVIDKSILREENATTTSLTGSNGIQGTSFYTFMGGSIEEKPDYTRVFRGMDIILTSGGEELNSFIEVINANTGVTGSQNIPTFTNLSEGRGVFSSRHKLIIPDKQINQSSRDSLRDGQYTSKLNFL